MKNFAIPHQSCPKCGLLLYALFLSLFATSLFGQKVTEPDFDRKKFSTYEAAKKARPQVVPQKSDNVPLKTDKTATGSTLVAMAAIPCTGTYTPASNDPTFTAIPRNDDGSFGPINLGWTFRFCDSVYNKAWINTNGNLTFHGPYSTYSPTGFPIAGVPMVAAFWADIDTRNLNCGQIWYKLTPNYLIVTWERTGYYNQHCDKTVSFNLVISDGTLAGGLGVGNTIGFRYGDMQFTTGDASGGSGGFGGFPATVGYNTGNGIDFEQIGRFDQPGTSYDGPFGANDGVDYLDNKCYLFKPTGSKFCCCGRNLVVNGDFEAPGNPGVNTLDYTYNPAVSSGATLPGQYNIVNGADALTINRCWVAQDPSTCTNASGKFLVVNGQTCGGRKKVWEQSFTVNDWTCYEFCASVKNLKGDCHCAFDVTPNIEVEFSMSGIGNVTQVVNLTPGACNWIDIKKQVCLWGYGTNLTIKIWLDESVAGDGNDIALDNIALIAIPNCPPPTFSITTGPFFPPTYYNITATTTPTATCPATYWEVCEVDPISLNCIPLATVSNPSAWWFSTTCFPHYNGLSYPPAFDAVGVPGCGQFKYGKLYRITLGTWGDCHGWGASSQYVMVSRRTQKMKIFTEEEVKDNPQAIIKAWKQL